MDLSRIQHITKTAERHPNDIQNLIPFAYLCPTEWRNGIHKKITMISLRLHKSIHIKFIVIFRFSFGMMSVLSSFLSREQDFGFVSLFVDKKMPFSFSSSWFNSLTISEKAMNTDMEICTEKCQDKFLNKKTKKIMWMNVRQDREHDNNCKIRTTVWKGTIELPNQRFPFNS